MAEKLGYTQETYSYDRLIAGHYPLITKEVTILSGETIVRGAVLGKLDIGGKYRLSLSAETDGSQVPVAIAAEDVDAALADKVSLVYLAGEFSEGNLTLGTGHTLDSIRDGLRDLNIYLKATQAV